MNWDTSLRGNSGIGTILAIVGLGALILALKLFGYVLAITEFAYSIIVFLFYFKILYHNILRKDVRFIIISIALIGVGFALGFLRPLTVAHVALKPIFAGMFYSSIILSIAGMRYLEEIPFFTGEMGEDIFMTVMMFFALFCIIYVVGFIANLTSEDLDFYTPTQWLVQNAYLDERYEAQTKTPRELLTEYLSTKEPNKDVLLNDNTLKDFFKKQYYSAKVRELSSGELQYTITNNVNPDENYEPDLLTVNPNTLEISY